MTLLVTCPSSTALLAPELEGTGGAPLQTLVQDSSLLALLGRLSTLVFVDGGTLVPVAQQNGSIGAPFSTIQAGVDGLASSGGVVLIAPGVYDEAVSASGFVRLESMFPSELLTPCVIITSVTATATGTVELLGVRVITYTASITLSVTFFHSTVNTLNAPAATVNARGCSLGPITCLSIFNSDNCVHSGLITYSSATATNTFSNGCIFTSAANIVGGGGTSVVLMDADSNFRFKLAGRTFTTVGRVGISSALARATISVTPPVLLAGAIGEAAAVSTVGTELEGLGTLSVISVQKSGVLAGGGALIGWRVSASNAVILQFLGPTLANPQNFFFSKLTQNT